MSARTGQSPVQTVPTCPVQIRAYHHIDVDADIDKGLVTLLRCLIILTNHCNYA